MKQLHRKDLFGWSLFNPERNLDFHSVLWVRECGNVVVDPLPMTGHDLAHLQQLGGAKYIVVTNSDHCRDALYLASVTGALIYGPTGESTNFPIRCDGWLDDNQTLVPELQVFRLEGSKTPGELALLLGGDTLITGDLIRCHQAGTLCLLPEAKLSDLTLARESVNRLARSPGINAVLVGDGWPVFSHGGEALASLVQSFS